MSTYNRKLQQELQSHNVEKKGHEPAYREQVDRFGLIDGTAADQFFIQKKGEEIHHLHPTRTFNALFEPTNTEEENKILSQRLNSGNRIGNLYNTPGEAHRLKGIGSAVHTLMIDRGLEHRAARNKWHPLLQELDDAAGTSLKHKLHLVDRYNKELRPLVNEAYDDAMTSFYEPTPTAQQEAKERVANHLKNIEVRKAESQMQTTATLMPGN